MEVILTVPSPVPLPLASPLNRVYRLVGFMFHLVHVVVHLVDLETIYEADGCSLG